MLNAQGLATNHKMFFSHLVLFLMVPPLGTCDRPRSKKPGGSFANITARWVPEKCRCRWVGETHVDCTNPDNRCVFGCVFSDECKVDREAPEEDTYRVLRNFRESLVMAKAAEMVALKNGGQLLDPGAQCQPRDDSAGALSHGFKRKAQLVIDPCMRDMDGKRQCWSDMLLKEWTRKHQENEFPFAYKKQKLASWHIGNNIWDTVSMGWENNVFHFPALDVGGNTNCRVAFEGPTTPGVTINGTFRYTQKTNEVKTFTVQNNNSEDKNRHRFEFDSNPDHEGVPYTQRALNKTTDTKRALDKQTVVNLYAAFETMYERGALISGGYFIEDLTKQLGHIAMTFGFAEPTNKMRKDEGWDTTREIFWDSGTAADGKLSPCGLFLQTQGMVWAGLDVVIMRVHEGQMTAFVQAEDILAELNAGKQLEIIDNIFATPSITGAPAYRKYVVQPTNWFFQDLHYSKFVFDELLKDVSKRDTTVEQFLEKEVEMSAESKLKYLMLRMPGVHRIRPLERFSPFETALLNFVSDNKKDMTIESFHSLVYPAGYPVRNIWESRWTHLHFLLMSVSGDTRPGADTGAFFATSNLNEKNMIEHTMCADGCLLECESGNCKLDPKCNRDTYMKQLDEIADEAQAVETTYMAGLQKPLAVL